MLELVDFGFARDYLLPLPSPDLTSSVRRMAEYTDTAALVRMLCETLRRPVPLVAPSGAVSWVLGPKQLMVSGLADAFSLHSARKVLPSIASPLPGVMRDRVDDLGRWCRDRSRAYDQSMGSGITSLQRTVSLSSANLGWYYHEVDLAGSIKEFLHTRGHGEGAEGLLGDQLAALEMLRVEKLLP